MDLTELDLLFGKSEDETVIDDEEFRRAVEDIDRQLEESQREAAWGW